MPLSIDRLQRQIHQDQRAASQPSASYRPLSDLSVRAEQRRAFLDVLAEPCAAHDARRGTPCWTIARLGRGDSQAVCGERIRAHAERRAHPERRRRTHGGRR